MLNTQPRGGGCLSVLSLAMGIIMFQHTAARRRLPGEFIGKIREIGVSTHSRAEAAADGLGISQTKAIVSTHSRAEAAASKRDTQSRCSLVSTHSRAEAAATTTH